MRPIKCGFRSLKGSLFYFKLYRVFLIRKQAVEILFSRLQSSTDLFRSGKTKKQKRRRISEQHDTSFLHTKYYSY